MAHQGSCFEFSQHLGEIRRVYHQHWALQDSILQDLARSFMSMLQQALAFVLGFMVRAGLQQNSISVRLGLDEGFERLD